MEPDSRKVCFVVMGFGKKTDYESGRTLDLDATYEAIIEPAARINNLRCIRADEIIHSGVIDTPMYEMLLRAELVIADISTGNANAVYELGVRHALRPNATIIMKESDGRLYFDLNHVNTFQYQHLGADIGVREAERAVRELANLMAAALSAERPDSPVYTYLPKLQQPKMTEDEYADLLDRMEDAQEKLSEYMEAGKTASIESRHEDAVRAFSTANEIKPGEPYILQQLALSTYKSKKPSYLTSLIDALRIIDDLNPERSNDPETLGITGSIHKRIWHLTNDIEQLNAATRFYSRGYEVRRDYYNGENFALCCDLRASVQEDESEANYDRMTARKVREGLIEILRAAIQQPEFSERYDQHWVYATLANSYFALGETENSLAYEKEFMSRANADWEIDSYQESKGILDNLAKEKPAELG